MWINLSAEEMILIDEALKQCNLHGFNEIIANKLSVHSPHNTKHTKQSAVAAARTYFSSDDLIINDDYVIWEDNGDALVMSWQKVPKIYIQEQPCNCGSELPKG